MSKVHVLKCWPQFFAKLASGEKTFEVRKNDRDYEVGDELHLREFTPLFKQDQGGNTVPDRENEEARYSGAELIFKITYLMKGDGLDNPWVEGLDHEYVVMGIQRLKPSSKLIAHARHELELMGYFKPETEPLNVAMQDHIMKMVTTFALEGHSGATAGYALAVLQKLLAHEPLTPLTGADDEWDDVSSFGDPSVKWQNKRCSRVLKGPDGIAFDVMAGMLQSISTGETTRDKVKGSAPITFPYTPKTETSLVEELGSGD